MDFDFSIDQTPEVFKQNQSQAEATAELFRLAKMLNVDVTLTPRSHRVRNARAYFEEYPVDIRNIIYSYLLFNPALGQCPTGVNYRLGQVPNYNLEPAILRVNKKIYAEAIEVLYTKNCFYATLAPEFICPLTRYIYMDIDNHYSRRAYFVPAITRVRKWTVVLGRQEWLCSLVVYPSSPFRMFCQSICGQQLIKLELLIPSKVAYRTPEGLTPIPRFLAPLALLRNIMSNKHNNPIVLRDVTLSELPDYAFREHRYVGSDLKDLSADEQEEVNRLLELAQSDQPVEHHFKMYGPLLRYAQSFETCPIFKQHMAMELCKASRDLAFGPIDARWFFNQPLGNPYKLDDLRGDFEKGRPFVVKNMEAREENDHPVELALRKARLDVDFKDSPIFKQQRKLAVEYLEPQYERLKEKAEKAYDFYKSEKFSGGLCDAGFFTNREFGFGRSYYLEKGYTRSPPIPTMKRALSHIRDFLGAFKREVPDHIDAHITRFEPFYIRFYDSDIGKSIEQMELAIHVRDRVLFQVEFRKALTALWNLWTEVVESRKGLFREDSEGFERGCDVVEDGDVECQGLDWSMN